MLGKGKENEDFEGEEAEEYLSLDQKNLQPLFAS